MGEGRSNYAKTECWLQTRSARDASNSYFVRCTVVGLDVQANWTSRRGGYSVRLCCLAQ